jgi:circadian clock protein KaiC
MEKINTNIQNLDKLILGGFPKNSIILLSGDEGAGKTIFSLSLLYKTIQKKGGSYLYITFEEKKEDIYDQAKQFHWDLKELERKKNLLVISFGFEDIGKNFQDELLRIIKKNNVSGLVIDSITSLSYLCSTLNNSNKNSSEEIKVKRFLYEFISNLKKTNVTCLLISQKNDLIGDPISRFLCDGVFLFNQEAIGQNYIKIFTIRKLRRTKFNEKIKIIRIGENGFDLDES